MDDGTVAVICFFPPGAFPVNDADLMAEAFQAFLYRIESGDLGSLGCKMVVESTSWAIWGKLAGFLTFESSPPRKEPPTLNEFDFCLNKRQVRAVRWALFFFGQSYIKNFAARWGSGYRRDVRTAGLGFDGDLLFTRLRMKAENGSRRKKQHKKNRPKVGYRKGRAWQFCLSKQTIFDITFIDFLLIRIKTGKSRLG